MTAHHSPRRPRLLTQNSRLKPLGIWNWTLPAWAGRLSDGRTYNTCPSAGICRHVCYALAGTYRIPAVRARHEVNLRMVLDDLPGWQQAMAADLNLPVLQGRWVRIHDAGDFLSDAYTRAWLHLARTHPQVRFYAYTKEIRRFRRLVEPDPPPNFRWVYSYGGTQDHLLDPETDRVADVFPDTEALTAAGHHSQAGSDLLAVTGPAPVGITANRIPGHQRLLAGRSFRQWQQQDQQRRARSPRRAQRSFRCIQKRSLPGEDPT
ncbi:GP88 family protein [Actinocatenispora rupis]|uniref:Gene product 88 domain-containing protein n=1 Tax=Actinocatenispora rupis TaxID=519421 RepID=A0A8J3IWZ6_9ACTN|nr:hypothetical protein [Actinocatenispora rupis]GID10200.1 hypothetical protein Aru02nite_10890 [Actinocatenispora rupis]